jgi:acyl dehydratase
VSPPLTDLAAGHVFDPITITIDAERARAYRRATGDVLALYEDENVVPPLAVAAFALGKLLAAVGLPGGSLHGSEGLEFRAAVPVGATVECRSTLVQRSKRAGWIACVLASQILVAGEVAIVARATVLTPVEAV